MDKKKINVAITGYYNDQFINNFIFNNNNNNNTNELAFKKYQELKKNAHKHNILINTLDLFNKIKPDCVIIVEYPGNKKIKNLLKLEVPLILLIEECEVVNNLNINSINLDYFHKIFTFDDGLISKSDKFLKFNTYSFIENYKVSKNFENKKLLTLIASNKKSTHLNELYSERLKIIEWYEKNNSKNFDLFGQSWDKFVFPLNNNSLRYLNSKKFLLIQKFFAKKRNSWKGIIKNKNLILSKYKFNIAFENSKNVKGYICEKIFDSFAASSIPIYYGASNIDQHIPSNTFIDYREFPNIKNLNYFLENISKNEYINYLDNIEKFLNSRKVNQFTSKYFSNSIINVIKDLFK